MYEATISDIKLFAGNFVPWQRRYFPCDGRLVPIRQHTALFALIGTRFGGDGKTTFGIPKLASPSPGLRYIICHAGVFPLRA
jgi:microcystin-dependent protein